MTEEKLLEREGGFAERQWETALRPRSFTEYVGQSKITENLKLFIGAARQRKEALDHVLIYGPPGLGKTTLANIIAYEMDVDLRVTAGPLIEKAGDLAAILTSLKKNDVLFIDEIHRLSATVEEVLYPAMEDFKLDITVGQGPGARALTIPIERFTLVGATTRVGLLTGPLRNRFGMTFHVDYYSVEDLSKIIKRSAQLLVVPVEDDAALEIARRARGTPRIANRLLRRLRDYAQMLGDGTIDREVAIQGLERLEVDKFGLDDLDRRLLQSLIEKYGGGPVGLNTLAATVGEEPDTLEEVYEPYLMQVGFLERTPRGRKATPRAYKHLGLPFEPSGGTTLRGLED
ncbi:MAG TPA: Holliday junction branch migration DNA helicase RuvB [Acidobacteriota bacterium]|jgi:Holliday junction DNA helicase RuvB|nr:Holliday junction branch migration DNA helicase RuvB [Acidobacteriota bacterium]HNT18727.1 Holliday junction branch migration DNA helicase RuvB [Acidobacteriota bacterium]HPA27801.1 Holliday junction branch migration DNA helicase RuvB [Acidobacteriota bacterium]HQO21072.1 Holliday junction branch migration DNA helicase RuvB [Acidobacteriota bacterium]HQQ47870.1 Holliday junction branch migration DNA helicase RuvB [Acidobacteriota bacterium]